MVNTICISSYYRPQTKFAKVMFSQAYVILSRGGGVRDKGHVLQGDQRAGDMVTEAGGTHPTGMHSCHSSAFTGIKKALKTYLNHFSSFNRDTQSV